MQLAVDGGHRGIVRPIDGGNIRAVTEAAQHLDDARGIW
jgi:hypothetical protein